MYGLILILFYFVNFLINKGMFHLVGLNIFSIGIRIDLPG
jgi:hypothetical protein